MSHTVLFGRETSCTRSTESMTNRVKPVHTAQHQQSGYHDGQNQINRPQHFRHHTNLRMYLVMRHTGRFGREQHLVSHSKNRQYGNRKEHDSQTSYPMCEAAPKQHPMRQLLNVVENRCPGGSEPRHGFKKGICYRRDGTTHIKRHHAEHGEQQPCECHHAIAVAPCNHVVSSPSQKEHDSAYHYIDYGSINEINIIRFPIEQRHPHANKEQRCFNKEQNT